MGVANSDIVFGDTKTDFSPGVKGPMDFDLIGYEMAFRQWLREAVDFRSFKLRITEELNILGFSDWAYIRTDIPLHTGFRSLIGTFNVAKFQQYLDNKLYTFDYAFNHSNNDRSIIYMSDIEGHINSSPIKSEEVLRNKEIVSIYKEQSFGNYLAVPIFRGSSENHAVFILTARNKEPEAFKAIAEKQVRKIHVIVKLTETVGLEKHPTSMLAEKERFDKLASHRSMKLLKLMSENDFNIAQAASAMHMSRTAADKQLASIRDKLGSGTTHGALMKAIKLGFIKI